MTLIDPVLIKARLGDLAGRFDVDALESCDSTSSELARRAERGAPAGMVIVADQQSAGRGRRGRAWLSAPEASLTFSLLWRFPANPGALSGLSLAVGVGLARALEGLGARDIGLKWPNDVLVNRAGQFAKLAGILIELVSDRRGIQAIIGIGLNLQTPQGEFPQPAIGLDRACDEMPDRHAVLAAILRHLAAIFETGTGKPIFGQKKCWQDYNAWRDQPVQILDGDAPPVLGVCVGVDDDGSLLLERDGQIERILSGDVSLRRQ